MKQSLQSCHVPWKKVLEHSFIPPVYYLNPTCYFRSKPSHFSSEREVENSNYYCVEMDV